MAAAPFAIPLLIILAACCLLALNKIWQQTFSVMLRGIANLVDSIQLSILGHNVVPFVHSIANAFRYADSAVQRAIGGAITWVTQPFQVFISYMATVFEKPTAELAAVVADVAHTIGSLRKTIIPAMIAAKTHWIIAHLQRLEAQGARVIHDTTQIVVHDAPRVIKPTVVRIIRASVAVPLPRIGRLEREGEAISKRLGSLVRRLSPAALVGLLATALGSLGLGWVRCSRVKKVGKSVCGMDSDLLDSLLADATLIVGTVSLLELAEAVSGSMEVILPQVRDFWRA